MEEEQVVIVGAGIAGLATAVALNRVGIPSLVLERSEELRTTGAALTLFPNAWLALDALGVSHKLNSLYPPCSGGSVTDVSTGAVRIVHLKDGTTIKSKILIGCDGLHSVVAQWLGLSAPVHSGRSAVRGLAVYPQGHGFGNSVRQYVDSGKRAGFVPLNDNEVYWFLTCQGGQFTYDPKEIQEDVLTNYAADFPQLYLDVVRHSDLSSLSWAPLMLRYPWNIVTGSLSKGNVTVAGDAMHPMTPDLGQGGGAALEDAVVLGRHIGQKSLEVGKALDGYVKERKWRAAGLVAGAYVSGWVQQGGSNWWRRLARFVYYKYLTRLVVRFVQYDCGKLPQVGKLD
ncbi:Monooxygenase 2 [Linum perenne]